MHYSSIPYYAVPPPPPSPHGKLIKAPRGRQGNAKLVAWVSNLLKIEVIEYGKWASKWLEMHSPRQIKKKIQGNTPNHLQLGSSLCLLVPPPPPPPPLDICLYQTLSYVHSTWNLDFFSSAILMGCLLCLISNIKLYKNPAYIQIS